jgi:dolichyl-phosphate-mannose-protein mannosyltransferase
MTPTEDRISPQLFYGGLAIITVIAAVLRIYQLSITQPTGDEYYTVAEAFDYMTRGHYGLVMWHHPKLRNILVFAAMKLLGPNVMGMRCATVAFGTLTATLTGLVARRLTRNDVASLMAALFIAVDALHIEFSRQAVQEEYVPFFLLAGIYLALRYVESKNLGALIGSGVMFGLGLASKWSVAIPLIMTFCFLSWRCLRQKETATREKGAELFFYVATLMVLPLTVFVLTYYPWFLQRGYDMGAWLASQKIMYAENLVHKGANQAFAQVQDHNPLLWFIRPVTYADFQMIQGRPSPVLGVSNPLVWLLTLPAMGCLISTFKRTSWRYFPLVALFWCSYLPFALTKRLIGVNSSLAVTPFAFMAVAMVVTALTGGKRNRARYLGAYVGLVILIAIPLYAMAIGMGYETFLQPIFELYRPLNER